MGTSSGLVVRERLSRKHRLDVPECFVLHVLWTNQSCGKDTWRIMMHWGQYGTALKWGPGLDVWMTLRLFGGVLLFFFLAMPTTCGKPRSLTCCTTCELFWVVFEPRTEDDLIGWLSWSDFTYMTSLGGDGLMFNGSLAFHIECGIWDTWHDRSTLLGGGSWINLTLPFDSCICKLCTSLANGISSWKG